MTKALATMLFSVLLCLGSVVDGNAQQVGSAMASTGSLQHTWPPTKQTSTSEISMGSTK